MIKSRLVSRLRVIGTVNTLDKHREHNQDCGRKGVLKDMVFYKFSFFFYLKVGYYVHLRQP